MDIRFIGIVAVTVVVTFEDRSPNSAGLVAGLKKYSNS
jgi:hypothetical protein